MSAHKWRNGLRSEDIYTYYNGEVDYNEDGFRREVLPKLETLLTEDKAVDKQLNRSGALVWKLN